MVILLVIAVVLVVIGGFAALASALRPAPHELRGLHVHRHLEPLAPRRRRARHAGARGLHVNQLATPLGERSDPNDPALLANLRQSGIRPDGPQTEARS